MQISTQCRETALAALPPSDRFSLFGRLLGSISGEGHRRAFLDWLQLNLELQLTDLENFLRSLPAEQQVQLETRLASGWYTELVPDGATAAERCLFLADLETVLALRQLC
jgi:hypothetical protein